MTRLVSRRNLIRLAAGVAAGAAVAPHLTATTFAEGIYTEMVVNTDRLNVRAEASIDAAVLEVAEFGAAVTADASQRLAADGVNWISVTVTETGTAGWVDFSFLALPGEESLEEGTPEATTDEADPAALTGSLWVTVADANLRSGAGLSYDVLTTLPIGQQVTVSGATEDADGFTWYPVTVSTIAGWIANIVVTDEQPANPDFSQGAVVSVDTDILNLREEAGLSAAVLATYTNGATATIVSAAPETADDIVWHQVEMTDDGKVGWLAEQYLQASGMGGTGFTVTVADGPLFVRTQPGIASEVVTKVPTGTTGTVSSTGSVAADGFQWIEIALDDQTGRAGWVASEFLTFD
jgi:uncharacterized protein YgiM (DUF1202 family)